jgi:hypothetical protein
LNDPFLAVSLADNVLGYLKADQNLSRDDVNALVRSFRTLDVTNPDAVKFETLPVAAYPENPNRVIASSDADAVIEELRTFGDNTPKPATVQPSQVKVRVVDGTGTNVSPSVVKGLADQGFTATSGGASTSKVEVSEIRYGYGQAEEAKALIPYFPDAKLVPDAQAKGAVVLVLGSSFRGTITVPSTTTTAPTSSTVPGAPVTTQPPVTTRPPTTTTTIDPSENCPT